MSVSLIQQDPVSEEEGAGPYIPNSAEPLLFSQEADPCLIRETALFGCSGIVRSGSKFKSVGQAFNGAEAVDFGDAGVTSPKVKFIIVGGQLYDSVDAGSSAADDGPGG